MKKYMSNSTLTKFIDLINEKLKELTAKLDLKLNKTDSISISNITDLSDKLQRYDGILIDNKSINEWFGCTKIVGYIGFNDGSFSDYDYPAKTLGLTADMTISDMFQKLPVQLVTYLYNNNQGSLDTNFINSLTPSNKGNYSTFSIIYKFNSRGVMITFDCLNNKAYYNTYYDDNGFNGFREFTSTPFEGY